MKVAYLGKIQLSDIDLSYLHEAQQLADMTYILEINPRFSRGPAFNITRLHRRSGIFKAVDVYPEFARLKGFVDLDKCYVTNVSGRLWMLKSIWVYMLLVRFLIKGGFEVVHLTWPPNVYEWVLYLLHKKMVLTVHDPIPHTGGYGWVPLLRRWLAFRLVPKFIILNKAQREDFINTCRLKDEQVIDSRLGCYTYLHTVVPQGAAQEGDSGGGYILFAGRISPYKGLDYLLPAMEMVHTVCPDCRLVVAGGGNYHFDISRYKNLDYIDIRNRFIPDEELVELIKGAAFLVCPYTDATQSGVVMSAYAFAKPVVATNVGGLPEMVVDGRYGMIVKEKDADALAEAIVELWQNKEKISFFSTHIKHDYSSGGDLSWAHIAKSLCQQII